MANTLPETGFLRLAQILKLIPVSKATFRSIELWKPTLFIDEADSFMKENEDMRRLLIALLILPWNDRQQWRAQRPDNTGAYYAPVLS